MILGKVGDLFRKCLGLFGICLDSVSNISKKTRLFSISITNGGKK